MTETYILEGRKVMRDDRETPTLDPKALFYVPVLLTRDEMRDRPLTFGTATTDLGAAVKEADQMAIRYGAVAVVMKAERWCAPVTEQGVYPVKPVAKPIMPAELKYRDVPATPPEYKVAE